MGFLIEEAKKFQFGTPGEVITGPQSVCLTPFLQRRKRVWTSIPAVHLHGKSEAQEFFQFAACVGKKPVCILTVQKAMHEMDKVADFTDNI